MVSWIVILLMISFVIHAFIKGLKKHFPSEFQLPEESVCMRTLKKGYQALEMDPGLAQVSEFEEFVSQVRKLGRAGKVENVIRRVK